MQLHLRHSEGLELLKQCLVVRHKLLHQGSLVSLALAKTNEGVGTWGIQDAHQNVLMTLGLLQSMET